MRQIILSQLYFWASWRREGSMMPPRRRSTRCRVDSETQKRAARRGQALLGNSRYPPNNTPKPAAPFWML